MNDKVSVIIPCYNQARYLVEAVDSVLAQTFPHTEIIVIDDGSTDNTASVASKSPGDRVILLSATHSGPSRPRNIGLERATGNYIQFLDADDVILPTKLERQLQAIPRDDGLAVIYCDYYHGCADAVYQPYSADHCRLDPRFDHRCPLHELARRWETQLSIPPIAFLFDARIFREHGIRLDEALPNHVDWDCWFRVARLPVRWHYLDAKLAVYRVTPGSITKNPRRMRDGYVAALDKHLRSLRDEPELRAILRWKRHETLCRYDAMIASRLRPPARWIYSAARRVYRHSARLLRHYGAL